MAFLALTLSSRAMRSSSSSSSWNFRLFPVVTKAWVSSFAEVRVGSAVDLLTGPVVVRSRPACTISKSLMARSRSSKSSSALAFAASSSACFRAFSARLMSFFWATRLARAHSRQKMSPRRHDTGSRAIPRQRPQEPKGRKESRERRADVELQLDRATARSWAVKTAREVFRLPWGKGLEWWMGVESEGRTVRHDATQEDG